MRHARLNHFGPQLLTFGFNLMNIIASQLLACAEPPPRFQHSSPSGSRHGPLDAGGPPAASSIDWKVIMAADWATDTASVANASVAVAS